MRHALLSAAIATSLALCGCVNVLKTATQAPDASAQARLTGLVTVTIRQLAGQGSSQYEQMPLPEARVSLKGRSNPVVPPVVKTGRDGRFSLDLKANETYEVSIGFQDDTATPVTLTGLAFVGRAGSETAMTLDVAHNLVASKLLSANARTIAPARFEDAVRKLRDSLRENFLPCPRDRADAAYWFDFHAGTSLEDEVGEMLR